VLDFASLRSGQRDPDEQQETPEIAGGMITAPERPGHGLRFKDEVWKFRI
jgi:L-alanine-DL-glutamate epimerase-like enolase superfamily enzyme